MTGILKSIERAWLGRNAPPPASKLDYGKGHDAITVITGASEGIGRALAFEFAANGYPLLLVARTEARLREVSGEIASRHPQLHVACLSADLTSPTGCEQIAAEVERKGWHVHFLVNNAGIGLGGSFEDQKREDILRLLDLNIRALTDLTARFLPAMLERGSGGVLNVASLGGFIPGPYQAVYYASKAYVISLTHAVAQEIRGRGVRISALAPGPVETGFHARMGTESAIYRLLPLGITAERVASVGYHNFMSRQTIIVPGLFPMFAATLINFIPNFIILPILALLLKPRRKSGPLS
jgi:short-subunit dehydrogenase